MRHVRGTGKVIASGKSLPLQAVLQRFLFPVLLLPAFFMAGCVTTEESADTRSSLAQLQIQVTNNNRDISQLKEQTGSIVAIRESQSTILSQTSDYSKELQSLKGRFDENKYFQDKTLKDIMSELELQKARISSLEGQLKEMKAKQAETKDAVRPAAETPDRPAADRDSSAPAAKGPELAAKLYDEAHIALKEKRYSEARRMFERFIKDYPKDSLSSNSFFWIGESYYAEKKYEDAILSYEDFIKNYPNHDKTRGAMLKQGYAFIELGGSKNKLAGKDILETLIEKYPKSKEAALAQKKIKEISSYKSAPSSKSKKKN